jgi:hypothetical protein
MTFFGRGGKESLARWLVTLVGHQPHILLHVIFPFSSVESNMACSKLHIKIVTLEFNTTNNPSAQEWKRAAYCSIAKARKDEKGRR